MKPPSAEPVPAVSSRHRLQARRIVRISRVVADLERSEAFYRDALGFITISRGSATPVLTDAQETLMRLGSVTIALVRFRSPGEPYPPDSRSNDLWFQHLAIVVSDMDAAYVHLRRFGRWQPITEAGPQQLPQSNGGVRAFKFHDPDGHPLELIWFPKSPQIAQSQTAAALFLTVDHSALSVSATTRSLNFYRTRGFQVTNRSLNQGPAQNRLDGLSEAQVHVTALQPVGATKPGLELLCYTPPGRPCHAALNDTVTDCVTIEVTTLFCERYRTVQDPDGHRLMLIAQGDGFPA